MLGLVILNDEQDTATLSLGFRRWAAQSLPLDLEACHDGSLIFFVPPPLPAHQVQQPHWLWNTSADAADTRWKGCPVQVQHPACLERRHSRHTCVLKQSGPVEPLVKAALRTAQCTLTVPTLIKVCEANKTDAPVPTGALNKSTGKRSVKKEDRAKVLMAKIFPDLKEDDPEYLRICKGIVGKQSSSSKMSDTCSAEVLAGVKALDPDNQHKFGGLRDMAERLELQQEVEKEIRKREEAAGRGNS